ncbi:hypothetical protein niasHT_000539 [Heterodera trifolii]|uniref:Laminin G domain-containing protein n=1 Tax=Heterodera trifolii TaxID=157864 RepID=A0ABD2M6F8_9BILA
MENFPEFSGHVLESVAFYQSGPVKLNFIALADQGYGQSHVQTFGDLSYSCSPNAQVPEVFAFNSGKNFTKLPAWKSPSRGTLAFQFRTLLPEGLLLYHGQINCPNFTICDYLAFELIDGHLMAFAKALNDGHWHSVVMERIINWTIFQMSLFMWLTVDGHGGVGAPTTVHQYPSTVWTIGLRIGFVGCLKNIRVNGINAQIAHAFRAATQHLSSAEIRDVHGRDESAAAPLSAGCPFSFAVDYCSFGASPRGGGTAAPCRNGGICSNAHNAHRASSCPISAWLFRCRLRASALSTAGGGWQSEAEDILVKFRLPPASTKMTGGTGSGLMVPFAQQFTNSF